MTDKSTLTIQGEHRRWEVRPDHGTTWSIVSDPLTADDNPAAALDGEFYQSLQEALAATIEAEAADNGEDFMPHRAINDLSEIPDGALTFERTVATAAHNKHAVQVALVLHRKVWGVEGKTLFTPQTAS